MVAPSFSSFPLVCKPYFKDNKYYVKVQTSTRIREVRSYTEAEYVKQWGKFPGYDPSHKDFPHWGPKNARGFAAGPVTLITHSTPADEPYFRATNCRYATDFGWHIASTDAISSDISCLPHLRYKLLSFDDILFDPTHLKSDSEVAATIAALPEYTFSELEEKKCSL